MGIEFLLFQRRTAHLSASCCHSSQELVGIPWEGHLTCGQAVNWVPCGGWSWAQQIGVGVGSLCGEFLLHLWTWAAQRGAPRATGLSSCLNYCFPKSSHNSWLHQQMFGKNWYAIHNTGLRGCYLQSRAVWPRSFSSRRIPTVLSPWVSSGKWLIFCQLPFLLFQMGIKRW